MLIVALVSVALLGFFPGMAGDTQMTQSQTYWRSASPIAVSEMVARHSTGYAATAYSMKIMNTGVYPIRITKVIGGVKPCWGNASEGAVPISYYLGPGEDAILGNGRIGGSYDYGSSFIGLDRTGIVQCDDGTAGSYANIAKTLCQNSNSTPGMLQVNGFGFEYIQYIEGQQITKREIGSKPLLVKCIEPTG